ncbi:MAG TPA: neutral/alkaline non-lysosomal ceramidase N-terminal domain-containing protein [Planctomycetota bacterium]|nr:neutral/alkaline non-lysosomal ceramidase N-terminal domain-containing protein [Planctomycetota bacterium]HUV38189.1 neutral/alkaline non-lysosomal ceramidase N-terminal domain-containing protein [Planctomycetota bacterium]
MSEVTVGHARRDITPPAGTWMMGYAARTKPCEGVHDPIYTNAVAVSDGSKTVVVITLDVSSVDGEVTRRIKAGVEAGGGPGPADVVINTSHTHSGPATAERTYTPRADAYLPDMIAATVAAATEALKTMKPATLSVGAAPLDIGCNRRAQAADGTVKIGANPDGPRLAEVTVWRFARDGADDVVLFSTPLHPSVMGPENYLISADWVGAARTSIERHTPGVRTVFLQGCCGNQSAYRDPRSFDVVAQHGETTREAVAKALDNMTDVAGAPVVTLMREVPLPFAEGGSYSCPVHGLRLGDAVFVGIAGEVFVEYALFGRERSTARSTIISGYTDGSVGYIPVASAYDEGGYETQANRYFESGKPWSPDVEGALKNGIASMLEALSNP